MEYLDVRQIHRMAKGEEQVSGVQKENCRPVSVCNSIKSIISSVRLKPLSSNMPLVAHGKYSTGEAWMTVPSSTQHKEKK
jgi:hypothetical protein